MDPFLKELYQEIILDHGKHPRHFHKLDPCTHAAKGDNPSCGDKINLYINIKNDKLQSLSFQGSGCAISTASASLMTDLLQNIEVSTIPLLFDYFHGICTMETDHSENVEALLKKPNITKALLEKLAILKGVQQFPMRVKCATLAWHTLMAALNDSKIVTTE